MSELSEQLRALVDAAPPVTLDEVEARAGEPEAERPGAPGAPRWTGRGRVWLVAAAVVVVVGLAAALVAVATGGDDDLAVQAGVDDPAAGDEAAWAWLDGFGPAPIPAPAPEGWTVLDVDEVRFAVPPGWEVSSTGCPAQTSTPGLVVVGDEVPALVQCAFGPPVARVVLGSESPSVAPEPAMLGALPAERIPDAGCPDCGTMYRLDRGLVVTLDGPDAAAIAATFGSSPARQALADGPVLDTSGWPAIDHQGVALSVPPSWPVVDLPASYERTETASGHVSEGGPLNPGTCGGGVFDADVEPTVHLGTSPLVLSCPFSPALDLRPASGVWLRTITPDDAAALGPTLASGTVDGLAIAVVDVDRWRIPRLGSAIDLVVTTPAGMVHVTIGGGADPAEARTILRSLRSSADGEPVEPVESPEGGEAAPTERCDWAESIDVQVFLDAAAGDAALAPMEAVVRDRPGVVGVVPRTQADSMADFQEIFVDHPELVASITSADLPPVLAVDLAADVDAAAWIEGLDQEPDVYEVVLRPAGEQGDIGCEGWGPISRAQADAAWAELERQEAAGWVPYAGSAAIPGLPAPSDSWVPAGFHSSCDRPASLGADTSYACVFDAPDGTIIGYHVSNLGFVPAERMASFDVRRALVERFGCDPREEPGWEDSACTVPGTGGDAEQ